MIKNERTKYRAAASVELRPPIPRERRQQRIAGEPLEIVAQPLIVWLAFEQPLDCATQLLFVHVLARHSRDASRTVSTPVAELSRRAIATSPRRPEVPARSHDVHGSLPNHARASKDGGHRMRSRSGAVGLRGSPGRRGRASTSG